MWSEEKRFESLSERLTSLTVTKMAYSNHGSGATVTKYCQGGPGYSSIFLVDLLVPKIKLRERVKGRKYAGTLTPSAITIVK
jgi:hypothetical protein